MVDKQCTALGGESALTVSDRTEANVVIVDAIRWYPLDMAGQ